MAKLPAKVRSRNVFKYRELTEVFETLLRDDAVTRVTFEIDKDAGFVRYNAVSADGRVATKSILGPGLEEAVRYDPSRVSKQQRDTTVVKLLKRGLTQAEVSTRLGISQALVSKIKRLSN